MCGVAFGRDYALYGRVSTICTVHDMHQELQQNNCIAAAGFAVAVAVGVFLCGIIQRDGAGAEFVQQNSVCDVHSSVQVDVAADETSGDWCGGGWGGNCSCCSFCGGSCGWLSCGNVSQRDERKVVFVCIGFCIRTGITIDCQIFTAVKSIFLNVCYAVWYDDCH